MMDCSKGQAGLEATMIYGIVILLSILGLIVLLNQGLFSQPEETMVINEVTGFSEIDVIDFQVSSNDFIILALLNTAGDSMMISPGNVDVELHGVACASGPEVLTIIDPGEKSNVFIDCTGTPAISEEYAVGNNVRVNVTIAYTNVRSTWNHKSIGTIQGRVSSRLVTTSIATTVTTTSTTSTTSTSTTSTTTSTTSTTSTSTSTTSTTSTSTSTTSTVAPPPCEPSDPHTRLTNENWYQGRPSFSPDGTKIIYESEEDWGGAPHDIWIMNADGSNHVQLTTEPHYQSTPRFSPDGTKIVYASMEDGVVIPDIWMMNADGSNHVQLAPEPYNQWNPDFGLDGSKIIYSSEEDGTNVLDIWMMNADGSNHVQLTTDNFIQDRPRVSPDGTKIVYEQWGTPGSDWDIWIMNADGSNQIQLTTEPYDQFSPVFSSDGSNIVYDSMEDGNVIRDIWIMDADGSNHVQLTTEPYVQGYSRVSPDGTKIVYHSWEDGGSYPDIWMIDCTGGTTTTTTSTSTTTTLPPDCIFVDISGIPAFKLDVVFVGSGFANTADFGFAVDNMKDEILSRAPYSANADKINFFKVEAYVTETMSDIEAETASDASECSWYDRAILLSVNPRFWPYSYFEGDGYVMIGDEYISNTNWPLDYGGGEFGNNRGDVERLVSHEFGHGFPGLRDEYVYADASAYVPGWNCAYPADCPSPPACAKWDACCSYDLYAGCTDATWYRSSQNSIMRCFYFTGCGADYDSFNDVSKYGIEDKLSVYT